MHTSYWIFSSFAGRALVWAVSHPTSHYWETWGISRLIKRSRASNQREQHWPASVSGDGKRAADNFLLAHLRLRMKDTKRTVYSRGGGSRSRLLTRADILSRARPPLPQGQGEEGTSKSHCQSQINVFPCGAVNIRTAYWPISLCQHHDDALTTKAAVAHLSLLTEEIPGDERGAGTLGQCRHCVSAGGRFVRRLQYIICTPRWRLYDECYWS